MVRCRLQIHPDAHLNPHLCSSLQILGPISFLTWWCRKRVRSSHSSFQGAQGKPKSRGLRRALGAVGSSRETLSGEDAEDRQAQSSTAVRPAVLGAAGRLAAFEKLWELREEGSCCDVTLSVGGHRFDAHRCVLAAQSQPLRAMLRGGGGFKEGRESVVTLRDVDPLGFALLIDFLYDQEVEIRPDNVETLLELSARYAVTPLRRHCCAFLAGSVEPGNACSLLAVADRYDCRRLRRDLLAYILKHFMLTCRGGRGGKDKSKDAEGDVGGRSEGGGTSGGGGTAEGFCQLPLPLVVEVLGDNRVNVPGEVEVFWAALEWLESSPGQRSGDADLVLSHVRFALISAETLAESVEDHPLAQ
ncbi:unnamed protein product, partial [Discosporangium mesarthrocarpum]